ncbi:MAG: ATP-dependent zinc protease [Campylobacterales bacterium]|nr:ATP-dependent zinc protease [Campylobacterales bacterium]
MALKNFLSLVSIVLFLGGCSYKLVDKEQLDAMDARLEHLEKNISQDISKELDEKLSEHVEKMNQHDQQVQALLEKSLTQQNETIQSLNTELTTFIKAKETAKPTIKKKRATVVSKVVPKDIKKLVVGSVEKVKIYPSNLIMNARIDTGAETSSINANDITEFERDGKKWVRFTLFDEKTNAPYSMERKVVRRVRILQSSLEEGYERRVVVKLKITIGDKEELSEFTLTSREHMQYPILVGRNVLQDLIVVDVSEQYMAPLTPKQDDKFKK